MKIRDLIGYILGLIVFIILIPAVMWRLSDNREWRGWQIAVFAILTVVGIGLSIWSIIYMRLVGRGNPMDAFNHEVAPRTNNLMTEGPYRICRNPMLLGVIVYYLGILFLLCSWKAMAVFAVFICIMTVQVTSEEKRLEQDFGEEYQKYKKKTKKIIPFIW